jgi:hypothetical protein
MFVPFTQTGTHARTRTHTTAASSNARALDVRARARACEVVPMHACLARQCRCIGVLARFPAACSHGDIESVSMLLRHGADATIGDNDK